MTWFRVINEDWVGKTFISQKQQKENVIMSFSEICLLLKSEEGIVHLVVIKSNVFPSVQKKTFTSNSKHTNNPSDVRRDSSSPPSNKPSYATVFWLGQLALGGSHTVSTHTHTHAVNALLFLIAGLMSVH